MLDVHPPHEKVHSWTQFFIHIAAITIGLLLALGLEQTVEYFHHRHQREQLEAALQRDGRANREYLKDDIAKAQGIFDWALEQASALEHAGATGPLTLRRIPHGFIGSPDAGVWALCESQRSGYSASGQCTKLVSVSSRGLRRDICLSG